MSESARIAIEHAFTDPSLLRQALTHRSYGVPHNERLEFIGDAVLGLVIARILYDRFPATPEGKLTRMRAHLVNEAALASVARTVGLPAVLRVGEGESRAGVPDRASMLADAMEAVFGAVFLDAGLDAVTDVVVACYGELLHDANPSTLGKDPKTQLQEILQAQRLPVPEYTLVTTTGKSPMEVFSVECRIPALSIVGSGTGGNRRAAEQDAATDALTAIAARDAQARG